MSNLYANATPAEISVGCSFAERFRSPQAIVENGGDIVGNPTFSRDGVELDGASDYVVYGLSGNEFDNSVISIVAEFWPHFDTDANGTYAIFSSSQAVGVAQQHYEVSKRDNAAANILKVRLGNTTIVNITEATYSPYWRVGERNVLQLAGTDGNTWVWLNKNVIVAGAATAWVPTAEIELAIGAINNGTALFDGKIGEFKVFKSLLDAQDAENYYNKTMYSYRDKAILDLPMRAAQHDPDNTRTLDISGGTFRRNNNHATLIGTTKLRERGYNFNTVSDYMKVDNDVFNTPAFASAVLFKPDFRPDDDVDHVIFDSIGTHYELRKRNLSGINELRFKAGNVLLKDVNLVDYEQYWGVDNINIIIISSTTNNTKAWLNTHLIVDVAVAWSPSAQSSLHIGGYFSSALFGGDILALQMYQQLLSSVQVMDLHLQMLERARWV